MGLVFESGCMDIFAVTLSLIICFVSYFKWSFMYWEKRKVPYLKPQIPWGTLNNFFLNQQSFGEKTLSQYQKARQDGHKIIGLFTFSSPVCMVLDPVLVKHIMLTDFKSFMNRGIFYNEKDDPLSAHLFSIEGAKWRNLRAKLTPTFTTGKMKMMFNTLAECGIQLKEAMDQISLKNEPIDIKDILARFTINVIGSVAFGLDCNTFADTESDFRKYTKLMFSDSAIQILKNFIGFLNPDLGRRLRICMTHKDVSDFFTKMIKETVEYREKNNIERNDFMQLLIQLKNNVNERNHEALDQEYNHDGKSLTIEELSAQAFVFFIAGFETSASAMTFCLFELAINPDIQEKVRNEINEVLNLHGGRLTYEAVHDLKYLGQVVDETLRKYPSLPILNRKCTEDYKIPESEIVIEKGTPVFIPMIGLHHDPKYFPDPEKFDPERFSGKNKHNIVPYTYLPFGEGPRNCIGLRFGLMQAKVGLAVLLKNFTFSLNSKTMMPLKMDPSSFSQTALGGIWLNVERLSQN